MATQAIDVPKKPAESVALERTVSTPMTMLELIAQRGASPEEVAKWMELYERWEANEARKAYLSAFAAFKAEAIRIVRNVEIKDGPLKGKKHADLFAVVDAVTPALSKHGLSHSWKLTKDEPNWLEVTCTIRHELGYSESASMGGQPDTGGAKNAIQARASSKSYLERYTLTAITGLAASNVDDDGNGSAPKAALPDERFIELQDWVGGAATHEELKKAYQQACKEADAIGDQEAKRQFNQWKNKRYKELYTQGAK